MNSINELNYFYSCRLCSKARKGIDKPLGQVWSHAKSNHVVQRFDESLKYEQLSALQGLEMGKARGGQMSTTGKGCNKDNDFDNWNAG